MFLANSINVDFGSDIKVAMVVIATLECYSKKDIPKVREHVSAFYLSKLQELAVNC